MCATQDESAVRPGKVPLRDSTLTGMPDALNAKRLASRRYAPGVPDTLNTKRLTSRRYAPGVADTPGAKRLAGRTGKRQSTTPPQAVELLDTKCRICWFDTPWGTGGLNPDV